MQKKRAGDQAAKTRARWSITVSAAALLAAFFINAFGPLAFAAAPGGAKAVPPEIPASLLSLNEREARYAFLVDKSEQRLYLYQWQNDAPRLIKTYVCATGENSGEKNKNGDKRTPEGIYFFTRVIEGGTLPPIYGIRAFPTDYPNFIDRLNDKDGNGIWLHGTDPSLSLKGTRGCVALENRDVAELSNYIRLRRTPIIIEERIRRVPPLELKKTGERVRGLLEEWRQAWEQKQFDRYLSFYAANFRSGKQDLRAWRRQKERLNRRYRNIRVRLTDPLILGHNGQTLAIFTQSYSSDRFANEGTKRLYFDADLKIIGEEWDAHKTGEAPPPIPAKVLQAFLKPRPVQVAAVQPAPSPAPAVAKTSPASVSFGARAAKVLQTFLKPRPVQVAAVQPAPSPAPAAAKAPSASVSAGAGAAKVPAPSPTPAVAKAPPAPSPAVPVAKALVPSPPPQAAPERKTVAAAPPAGDDTGDVRNFVETWRQAWQTKDLDRYMDCYSRNFRAQGKGWTQWKLRKQELNERYRSINVSLKKIKIGKTAHGMRVTFYQDYRSDGVSSIGMKSIDLRREKNAWKIVGERFLAQAVR